MGPGVNPRMIAGKILYRAMPPPHCEALRDVTRALRKGDPLPPAPPEGWGRDDLTGICKGLEEHWGICICIEVAEPEQNPASASSCWTGGEKARFHYRWSCRTGALRLEGATATSGGKGAELAKGTATSRKWIPQRVPSSIDGQMRHMDQCIYSPPTPTAPDVKAALRCIPYPRISLGLVPHPTKGATVSPNTIRMPNLTKLLNRFASGQNPRAQYTTIMVSAGAPEIRAEPEKYGDALNPSPSA